MANHQLSFHPLLGWIRYLGPRWAAVLVLLQLTCTTGFGLTQVRFGAATNYGVQSNPRCLTLADFNRDGNLDIATANDYDDSVSVLLGDGMGGFVLKTNYYVWGMPNAVGTGDFNNDRILDLVVTGIYGDSVAFLAGTGDGNFMPATI
jgi:hypothetical protein